MVSICRTVTCDNLMDLFKGKTTFTITDHRQLLSVSSSFIHTADFVGVADQSEKEISNSLNQPGDFDGNAHKGTM